MILLIRVVAMQWEVLNRIWPMLLLMDPSGGHLGGTAEMIDVLKFALWQTGHPDFQYSPTAD